MRVVHRVQKAVMCSDEVIPPSSLPYVFHFAIIASLHATGGGKKTYLQRDTEYSKVYDRRQKQQKQKYENREHWSSSSEEVSNVVAVTVRATVQGKSPLFCIITTLVQIS